MNLLVEPHSSQADRWPKTGRHILAQYDAPSVVVYQAYRSEIGRLAAEHGYFGGSFSFSRMSWIKPNFLWMMYRSDWATKEGQDMVLAIRLKRDAFEHILAQAVHSTFVPAVYNEPAAWKRALQSSDVRLQWDPDHGPAGQPLPRRAIQLGLRGDMLAAYARSWILAIHDVTAFVHEQRANVQARRSDLLLTPREEVFHPADPAVAARLQLDTFETT